MDHTINFIEPNKKTNKRKKQKEKKNRQPECLYIPDLYLVGHFWIPNVSTIVY